MSTQRKAQDPAVTLTDEMVQEYLREHPDFFHQHASLLAILRVPHPAGGAVSLVERQVSVLRDQNRHFKRKLMELVQVGRDNDQLNRRLHRLTLDLLQTDSLDAAVSCIHDHLRREFSADDVALRLVRAPAALLAGGLVRELVPNDPALEAFGSFMKASRPICGHLKETQLRYLFEDRAEDIGSAALIPLGSANRCGMLAIGSHDPEHFHPAMDTLFLRHMGDLVEHALRRFLPDCALPAEA